MEPFAANPAETSATDPSLGEASSSYPLSSKNKCLALYYNCCLNIKATKIQENYKEGDTFPLNRKFIKHIYGHDAIQRKKERKKRKKEGRKGKPI